MTVRSANMRRRYIGLKLPSIGSRQAVSEDFLEFNSFKTKYAGSRDIISPKSVEFAVLDNSKDVRPSGFCQEMCFFELISPHPSCEMHKAAIKLQKAYKSYRTRRNLADCAVVIEELWWRALDFASLKRSSISFFDAYKPETAVSRWARARTRAAKVGKGLSKSKKAQKLALQHWLEAIDPRHRYGHNLQFYYDIWFESESTQPFFYWLDIGNGKEVDIGKCSRIILQQQCVKYLGPKERAAYEVIIKDGKLIYKLTENVVHTADGKKWIFVLSTYGALYVGEKKKGRFQHSSFLSGGATTAAGRLVVKDGFLKAIWPYSGHYQPTEENFREFTNFLEENNVDLTNVKKCSVDDDDHSPQHSSSFRMSRNVDGLEMSMETIDAENDQKLEHLEVLGDVEETLEAMEEPSSAEFHMGKPPLPEVSVAPSRNWTTGAGPRIGWMREYPSSMQCKALEQVYLSPTNSSTWTKTPIPSPRPSPSMKLSPQLAQMCNRTPTISLKLPKPKKKSEAIP